MAQKFILLSVLWLVVAIFARAEGQTDATDSPATEITSEVTTGEVTTGEVTTGDVTTGDVTTGDVTTGDVTTGDATTALTTSFNDPCNSNPCGTGSTCEARFDDYVCLCLAGDSYNNVSNSCERSKVFPGKLKVKKAFNEKMSDPKSKEFKETADLIIPELDKVYEKTEGYSRSVVLELLSSTTSVSKADPEVIAVVQIIFKASSEITEADVKKKFDDNKCETCVLSETSFEPKDLCDDKSCDKESTHCETNNGILKCACIEGYVKTNYTDRICAVACPLGKKLKDEACVKCSFGYSGFNCSENWKLILVIVGSVLGGLLLIALILLPVVATQKSNKMSQKSKSAEMEKPYTNLSPATQPMASNKFGHSQGLSFNGSANGNSGFQNGGVSMFPRAGNPTNSMDNRTNLEMKPSNGRQNFGHMNSGSEYSSRIYDEPEDIPPYAQARPQKNPYAQNQPRMNPYAQNQGHSNPHYAHDDGRRYY